MADPKTSGAGTSSTTATRPARPKPELLPPWKVLLHNDDVNDMDFVIDTIVELTTLNRHAATVRKCRCSSCAFINPPERSRLASLSRTVSSHRSHARL